MRTPYALIALVVVAGAGAAALWWRDVVQREPAPAVESRGSARGEKGGEASAAAVEGPAGKAASDAAPRGEAAGSVPRASEKGTPVGVLLDGSPPDSRVTWPGARRGNRTASGGSTPAAGEPTVPVKLAFRALWYLGVDPEAEKTWARAINDPAHPAGVRSDLIVDMVDEGYSDNNRPTKADLPVILARLEILERYAPYAMDEVNAKAFEEAYRTLLELYVRLGGKPRSRR